MSKERVLVDADRKRGRKGDEGRGGGSRKAHGKAAWVVAGW